MISCWFKHVEISYFVGRDSETYLLEWWKDLNCWAVYHTPKEEIYPVDKD